MRCCVCVFSVCLFLFRISYLIFRRLVLLLRWQHGNNDTESMGKHSHTVATPLRLPIKCVAVRHSLFIFYIVMKFLTKYPQPAHTIWMQNNAFNLRQIIYGKYFIWTFSLFFFRFAVHVCVCVWSVWLKCDNLLCNSLPKLSLISDHFSMLFFVGAAAVAAAAAAMCFSFVIYVFQ